MTSAPASTVRALLDGQVANGHLPGYAAAVRRGGQVEVLAGGVLTLGEDRPVRADTFRLGRPAPRRRRRPAHLARHGWSGGRAARLLGRRPRVVTRSRA